jgi:multidrug efflux pump subunit AcrB
MGLHRGSSTLAAGANALNTAEAARATVEKLRPIFPHGLEPVYPCDTNPFVKISIEEVVKTLFEAIGLLFLSTFATPGRNGSGRRWMSMYRSRCRTD